MNLAVLISFVVILVIVIAIAVGVSQGGETISYEPPERRAGRRGEQYARELIESVLREDDRLFSNVTIAYEDKETELDNVVVNNNGVFIIEVKNYSGRLEGSEDDFEWTKIHTSSGGNEYEKTVKNPIRQVKRQIYIMSKYLRWFGCDVWVDGFAIILGADSPVDSPMVLKSAKEIDRVIHGQSRQHLDNKTLFMIEDALRENKI